LRDAKSPDQKYLHGETTITKAEREKIISEATKTGNYIIAWTALGVVSYSYLLFPAGKVIRDKMEAGFSRSRYWMRRVIPALGLAVPLFMLRNAVREQTLYVSP